MKKISMLLLCSMLATLSWAQTISGQVINANTKAPIPFATVKIMDQAKGTITNDKGQFEINGLEIGRYDVEASFVGYQPQLIANVLVASGKSQVLTFSLHESLKQLEGVTVRATYENNRPMNQMAGLSGETLKIESAKLMAGSIGDPARLASTFAGVTTGNLQDNGLVIRGNSPKGMLWRVEGVEVFNPNHLAGGNVAGGGFVNIFGSNMLANADFLTGAFPADYGNASSGVMDLHLREGNAQKREYFAQVGVLGIETGAEGYFKKGGGSTYNIGARVSSLGTIGRMSGSEAPDYHDVSFNMKFPTAKAGTFKLWGIGGQSSNFKPKYEYQEQWEEGVLTKYKYPKYENDWFEKDMHWAVGATGISHEISFKNRGHLKTDLVATGNFYSYKTKWYDEVEDQFYDHTNNELNEWKYTLQTNYAQPIGQKVKLQTGFTLDQLGTDFRVAQPKEKKAVVDTLANFKEQTTFAQAYLNGTFQPTNYLTINAGVHLSHFGLTNETTIEPRMNTVLDLGHGHSVGFAYGRHSQREQLSIYYTPDSLGNRLNEQLKMQQGDHYVLNYSWALSDYFSVKIAGFYQHFFHVPVEAGTSYSLANFNKEWLVDHPLVNTGTVTNKGVELTVNRSFHKGWYWMTTATLFDAQYTDGNGTERNSKFNNQYVVNMLAGKEFILKGHKKQRVLGLNIKGNFMGGGYHSPLLYQESIEAKHPVYDQTRAFSVKSPDNIFVDASIYIKTNHKHYTSSWTLDFKNATLSTTYNGYKYNMVTGQMDRYDQFFILPSLAYRIEF